MGWVRRFEDLVAWQKAWEWTKAVYEITRQGKFTKGLNSLKVSGIRCPGSKEQKL